MGAKKQRKSNEIHAATNCWDVLKAIIDGLFDFISLNKVAALGVLWYIIRDIIFVFNLPEDYDYSSHLLNGEFLEYLFENENIIIVIESAVIAVLVISCIFLIIHSIALRKEIKRISDVRSEAIHGKEKIVNHMTSE